MEILSGALCISLSDTEMGGQPLGQIYEKKNNAMREREKIEDDVRPVAASCVAVNTDASSKDISHGQSYGLWSISFCYQHVFRTPGKKMFKEKEY